jgi:hypothetical protein
MTRARLVDNGSVWLLVVQGTVLSFDKRARAVEHAQEKGWAIE